MATYCYTRSSGVRALVKEQGKRCSASFLDCLDRFIYEKVLSCCKVFNGNKKTLDAAVAKLILK